MDKVQKKEEKFSLADAVDFLEKLDQARTEHVDLIYEKEERPLAFSKTFSGTSADNVSTCAMVPLLPVALQIDPATAEFFHVTAIVIGQRPQMVSYGIPAGASLFTAKTPWKFDEMCTGQNLVITVEAKPCTDSYEVVETVDDPAALQEREYRLAPLYDHETTSLRRTKMLEKQRATILAKPLPKIARVVRRERTKNITFSGILWVRVRKESPYSQGI